MCYQEFPFTFSAAIEELPEFWKLEEGKKRLFLSPIATFAFKAKQHIELIKDSYKLLILLKTKEKNVHMNFQSF